MVRIEPPTVRNLAVSINANPLLTVCILAAQIATINGEPLKLEELLDGDLEEYAAVLQVVNDLVGKAVVASTAPKITDILAKFKKDAQ
jgi:hypothetical protein